MTSRFLFHGCVLLSLATALGAQSTRVANAVILGTVADTNLRPVAGADVNFAGSGVHATTDSLGRFRVVKVPAGRFLLIARVIGFRPGIERIEVADGDTLRLAFTLEPATAQELATVVITERAVSAKLREFDARRRVGLGEFFTRDDIDRINGVTMADVLRRAKSVRISWDGSTALSAREPPIKPPCPMAIYLDGVPLGAERLDYLPSPKQIAAVEVYGGAATLPLWLLAGPGGTRRGCGAVLVWTLDGSGDA